MTEAAHPLHEQRVGQIAAQRPGASDIFRRYGIDFCCQGHVSLAGAANRRNLDLNELELALNALDPNAVEHVPHATDALIDHIRTRFHTAYRQQIPDLIKLSRKVETVHLNHPKAPVGLAETLQWIWGKLELHIEKEQTVLFPAMRNPAIESLALAIRQMRHDHNQYAAYLDQMARLTDDYILPEDACRSWQMLYAGAEKLAADLMEHVHLMNNILFPRFETTTHV